MTNSARLAAYTRCNGTDWLTPAQTRRARHKRNHAGAVRARAYQGLHAAEATSDHVASAIPHVEAARAVQPRERDGVAVGGGTGHVRMSVAGPPAPP
jgi:hypothetical protein